MPGSVKILGVPFSKLSLDETVLLLTSHIQNKERRLFHLITANPEITITSQTDDLLKKIINEADLITPDGVGIVIASKRKGDSIRERVTGFDLLLKMLEKGNGFGWSFYLLGTDEHTNMNAAKKIAELYPNVKISGRHHGFFNKDEEALIISEIERTKPDILIVAMGAPYSDKWIYEHKHKLNDISIVFGVGGSLDVIAGKVKPTPAIWKRLNLEWLHRLLTVPVGKGQKSRWRRQVSLPKFLYRAIIKKG